jgi:hypothetical protein
VSGILRKKQVKENRIRGQVAVEIMCPISQSHKIRLFIKHNEMDLCLFLIADAQSHAGKGLDRQGLQIVRTTWQAKMQILRPYPIKFVIRIKAFEF